MALPRVFISTDLRLSSEEKDDAQSLIHALLYQDKYEIVGIAGSPSKWNIQDGLVGDIDKVIDVYAQDLPAIEAGSPALAADFKSAAELKAVSWQGATDTAPSRGYSAPTDASRAIIAEAREAAAAGDVLNVLTWGGETDLAQALHDAPEIASHVRFFSIDDQDPAAYRYIQESFKGELDTWVDNLSTFRGTYASPQGGGGPQDIIKGWHQENARGHGALGDLFSELSGDIFNVSGVKMGDSPTVLRFISGGPDDPTRESWGGEFVQAPSGGAGRYYTDDSDNRLDFNWPDSDGAMTVYEDRAAWLADFARRLDWLKDDESPGEPSEPGEPTEPAEPTEPGDGGDGGEDTITVRASGDDWQGDPEFALTIDGQVIDASTTVTADRGDGEWDVFTFKGDFGLDDGGDDGARVGVRFLDDAYAGSPSRDRNLYVDEVTLNSEADGTDHAFYRTGVEHWDF